VLVNWGVGGKYTHAGQIDRRLMLAGIKSDNHQLDGEYQVLENRSSFLII